jgi:hypothetical protein
MVFKEGFTMTLKRLGAAIANQKEGRRFKE